MFEKNMKLKKMLMVDKLKITQNSANLLQVCELLFWRYVKWCYILKARVTFKLCSVVTLSDHTSCNKKLNYEWCTFYTHTFKLHSWGGIMSVAYLLLCQSLWYAQRVKWWPNQLLGGFFSSKLSVWSLTWGLTWLHIA